MYCYPQILGLFARCPTPGQWTILGITITTAGQGQMYRYPQI
jgi:hypothetical protein